MVYSLLMSNYKNPADLTVGDSFTHGGNVYRVQGVPFPAEARTPTGVARTSVSVYSRFGGKEMLRIPNTAPLRIV
jgi:hypothetical protein